MTTTDPTAATDSGLPEWRWSCDKILIATDGSPPSLSALGWAARIAEDVPAQLLAVYAYEADIRVDIAAGIPTGVPIDVEISGEISQVNGTPAAAESEADAALVRVARWCADHGASGFGMRCEAPPGDVRSVLRDTIGRENPDLVVVGVRGGGGFPGLVVGSVTEWMTQIASFPLAVVPEIGQQRTGGPVVVGVDGSTHSGRALDWAIGLAGRLHRPVHAVFGAPWDTSIADRPGMKAVHHQIECAQEHVAAVHTSLDLFVHGDHPVTTLAARAADEEAEVIVVGARGYGQFSELSVGRLPRQLLHVARRPVVIVAG